MSPGRPRAIGRVIGRTQQWMGSGLRPYLARRLSREVRLPRDLEGWVRFAFSYRLAVGLPPFGWSFSLRPTQIPSEISRLLRMVAAERPRRVLEVGSAGGGNLFLFARAASPDALVIGMDLPPSPGDAGLADWRMALFEEAFAAPGQRVRIVRGDSHSDATAARVRRLLAGAPLDFLFIDGDHSYEGVRRDFELYAPLVHPGGLIAFHDIVPDAFHRHGVRTSADTGEVPRFWAELKDGYRDSHEILEIVENPDQDGLGIGVLRA